jgi:ferredoxin
MLTLYFSGTGNTKYIAEHFSKMVQADCHSIEEEVDFQELIAGAGTITFCYPVYGSCVPLIMREFVAKYKSYLNDKKIIIFCTQNLFSGDGARIFTELLRDIDYDVIYAEHFNMPNNICNLFFYPLSKKESIKKYIVKADKKINKACENINNGIIERRGFNVFSKYLGFIAQRSYFAKIEQAAKEDVKINSDCVSCLLCIKICPMKNLESKDNKVIQKGNCTLCYRCVNACPKKAMTVLWHGNVKKQYIGISAQEE